MDGSGGRGVVVKASDDLYFKSEYPSYDAFGLQEMYRLLLRRRNVVLGVFALITLAGAAYALLRPQVYEATALLMMRPNEPQVATTENQRPQAPDNGYVQSQVEILRSPGLARQLVDRLGLAPGANDGNAEARRAAAARSLAGAIAVQRRDGTYIIEVTARSNDPGRAATIANELIAAYFASREQARIEYATQTSDWLHSRLAEMRNEVQLREAEVEQYRAANGLLVVDGTMLAEQQLRDAEASVVAARMDYSERQARYRQVRDMINRGGSAETTAGALTSETMVQLRARQADVARRLAEYSERYGDLHPTVQTARAEQEDINRQIQAEVARLSVNLDNEAEIAGARVATLQQHLASVRGRLVGNNGDQVRLRELERNAQAARAVYENFLLRYQEVSDGAGGLGGEAQIVSRAAAPTDSVSRSPALVILLAAALGLAAGALAAFLAEQFSTTLQTADDVERKIGVPMLTSLPLLHTRSLLRLPPTERHPAGFAVAKPMSAFAEAVRMLRARIFHFGPEDVKIVALTSALAGEGKSSAALSLARVTALSGRKAIIIDCDLRRRSLNHMLCIEPIAGITQVLRGEKTWGEVTGRDEVSGAHILPAASEDFVAEDLFNSDAMRQLTRELSQCYDLIVLDCAPVLTLADVRDLASLADGVVVVARRGKTPILALQTAISELRAVNAEIIGIAFNGVDMSTPGRLSYADPLYFAHAARNQYLAES
jgi:polysaccharide biosynthesis transport protein